MPVHHDAGISYDEKHDFAHSGDAITLLCSILNHFTLKQEEVTCVHTGILTVCQHTHSVSAIKSKRLHTCSLLLPRQIRFWVEKSVIMPSL